MTIHTETTGRYSFTIIGIAYRKIICTLSIKPTGKYTGIRINNNTCALLNFICILIVNNTIFNVSTANAYTTHISRISMCLKIISFIGMSIQFVLHRPPTGKLYLGTTSKVVIHSCCVGCNSSSTYYCVSADSTSYRLIIRSNIQVSHCSACTSNKYPIMSFCTSSVDTNSNTGCTTMSP